ncbi:F-box/kelch-repeat protein At3g06240-like [Papaver somniferum]|uniref:F-box/kelch-repeat protein At3g06240-like n=1 Tax=Papaver somniferum TaxID=3469 RepID=UPI000E6F9F77|nr:F-box/kelch-repeat protein At3g06240-like [Papaver somniferum]
MSRLPEEIIENILSWLPVKSIARFRCVSKYWCNHLFQNPKFVNLHLEHALQLNNYNLLVSDEVPKETYLYSIDHTVLSSQSTPFLGQAVGIDFPFMSQKSVPQILGSCNGLICIAPYSFGNLCIWNPCTKEYKEVPEIPIEFPSVAAEQQDYLTMYRFGYDCRIEDYKVLRIVGFDAGVVSEARLYTLGLNTWRSLGFIPFNFSFGKNAGYLLNGVLYWIVSVCRTGNESSGVIVSFDICNETFHDMPLPNNYSNKDRSVSELGMWEGKLCILRMNHKEHPKICKHHDDHVDVWTMNGNTWSKFLNITAQLTDLSYRRPLQTLPNGDILLEGRPEEGEGICLVSYNPKLERARTLKIHGFPEDFELVTYIETLVSVNSGIYVEQQQQRGRIRRGNRRRPVFWH